MKRFEAVSFALVFLVVIAGVIISKINDEFYKYTFVVEDGIVESCTAVFLFIGAIICFRRVWILRKSKSLWFLFCTLLLGSIFIFGAGEEISWGQRIFDVKTSDFFQKHNAQEEMNLHNLTFTNSEGKKVKINKLVFGKILTVVLILYMIVMPPLYRRKQKVKAFIDAWAVPVTQNRYIIAYLILLGIVSFCTSSKKGELLEFGGSFIILFLVLNPFNKQIFQPRS